MHYLRSGSDSLEFTAILKVYKRARFLYILELVLSAVKHREIFRRFPSYFLRNLFPFHVKKRP